MAFELPNLHVIRRGKDLFYCILEARKKLLSAFSDEYLNNCMRTLSIETLSCNDGETSFIQNFLPGEIGPFWLISESNLLRLNQFMIHSRHIACQRASFGYQSSPNVNPSNFVQHSEFSTWNFQGKNSEVKTIDSAAAVSNEATVNKGLESSPNLEAVESDDGQHLLQNHSENRISVPQGKGETSSNTQVSATSSENKKTFTLSEEEMSQQTKSEFAEIRRFYALEINADPEGNAMQNVTITKMFERIYRFLWFLQNVKNMEPKLTSCSDPQLVEEFVHYMMQVRGIKSITCSRYITAFINVAKVPIISNVNQNLNDSIEKIRAIQRQLERLARRERVDALAKKPELEKIVYPELLELCRELTWEVHEKSGQAQARSCMNLCLLLLYCSANPGRSKEYISLRIYKGQSDEDCKDQNFICFHDDGTVMLIEDSYKTRGTYGVNRTDLTPLSFLTYYLNLYRNKMRPLLLIGKGHDFFFMNQRGDAFTQNSYSSYVSAIFEKYF